MVVRELVLQLALYVLPFAHRDAEPPEHDARERHRRDEEEELGLHAHVGRRRDRDGRRGHQREPEQHEARGMHSAFRQRRRRGELATVPHYCGERECGVGDGIARVQHTEIEAFVDQRDRGPQQVEDQGRAQEEHEEQRRRAAPAGSEDEPRDRGEEQDVGEGVGTPHDRVEEARLGGRGHDEERPRRDGCRDREGDTVEQPFAVPTGCPQHQDAHDPERQQWIAGEVEDIGERHPRSLPSEVRIRVPDEVADDPAGHARRDEPPGQPVVLGPRRAVPGDGGRHDDRHVVAHTRGVAVGHEHAQEGDRGDAADERHNTRVHTIASARSGPRWTTNTRSWSDGLTAHPSRAPVAQGSAPRYRSSRRARKPGGGARRLIAR